jgi:uncharacterized damage-inducible protein DinB
METAETVEQLLIRLADVPVRIVRAVAGRSNEQISAVPAGGDWSAAEVLAHIRASDAIISYRAYAILTRDNPPLADYNERRWAEVAGYAREPFHESLRVFTLHRAELVNMLRQVRLEDWQRVGTHEVRGAVSLLGMMTYLVEHEEEHCAQLEAMQ